MYQKVWVCDLCSDIQLFARFPSSLDGTPAGVAGNFLGVKRMLLKKWSVWLLRFVGIILRIPLKSAA
jgi:hypothetical protein